MLLSPKDSLSVVSLRGFRLRRNVRQTALAAGRISRMRKICRNFDKKRTNLEKNKASPPFFKLWIVYNE